MARAPFAVSPVVATVAAAAAAAAAAALAAIAGCRSAPVRAPGGIAGSRAAVTASAAAVTSNILRSDYAGSAVCHDCHADIAAAWEKSPMHRMTRVPELADIRAPFDGRELRFKGDVARVERVGAARFVRLRAAGRPEQLYRVTRVIGGRHREDFAGVEVGSTEPGAPVLGDRRTELVLPVSYVFETESFRLKGYSVMVPERPGMRAGGVWNQTCIFCHNTVPYFDDLWGALYGAGAPRYQGEVVDRVLPAASQMRYAVTDGAALARALGDEVTALDGGSSGTDQQSTFTGGARPALRRAILEARARFEPRHFIELGVGCEACHGGSRAHADDPRRLPTFEPRAAFLAVSLAGSTAGGVTAAEWQNRACARCHQVLFSRYPYTWEGGSRRTPAEAGGSHITSGEARDFLLGGCARAMACTTCHDPHAEDRPARLQRLATPAGNGVCTGCHGALAGPQALRAHARHDPAGAGGSCVACHMPRKNMGLGYALTRYHRIGSPTDPARVEHDRPIECVMCHADRTVTRLLADIERMWGRRYDAGAIERLYGAGDANVLITTIERGLPHERATAVGIARGLRFRPAAPAIARAIQDTSFPLVSAYARAALADIEGRSNSAVSQDSLGGLEPPARGTAAASDGDDDD